MNSLLSSVNFFLLLLLNVVVMTLMIDFILSFNYCNCYGLRRDNNYFNDHEKINNFWYFCRMHLDNILTLLSYTHKFKLDLRLQLGGPIKLIMF